MTTNLFLNSPSFPSDISIWALGGPEFNTNIVSTNSGAEFRNSVWDSYLSNYSINFSATNEAFNNITKLIDFFKTCKGKAIGFRFKDHHDYKTKNGFLTLISKNNYQLNYRTTTSLSIYTDKKITKPINGTLTIFKNSYPFYNYSIDWDTGIISVSELKQKTGVFYGGTNPVIYFPSGHDFVDGETIFLSNSTLSINNSYTTVSSVVDSQNIRISTSVGESCDQITVSTYLQPSDQIIVYTEFDKPCRFDDDNLQYMKTLDGDISVSVKIKEILV